MLWVPRVDVGIGSRESNIYTPLKLPGGIGLREAAGRLRPKAITILIKIVDLATFKEIFIGLGLVLEDTIHFGGSVRKSLGNLKKRI